MGNCLVTKLKGVVDNDNLRKLGAIRVKITNYDPATNGLDHLYIRLPESATEGITCEVIGNGFISTSRNDSDGSLINPVKKIENYGNTALYFSAGTTFFIDFTSKYNIAGLGGTAQSGTIHGQSVNLEDIAYATELDIIQMTGVNSFGDISVFKTCPKIDSIIMYNSQNVIGDISTFADCVNLTKIGLASTGVTGAVENYCKEACKLRTSGTVLIDLYYTAVTFMGSLINEYIDATFTATGCTLSNGWSYDKATDTWTAPAQN